MRIFDNRANTKTVRYDFDNGLSFCITPRGNGLAAVYAIPTHILAGGPDAVANVPNALVKLLRERGEIIDNYTGTDDDLLKLMASVAARAPIISGDVTAALIKQAVARAKARG